MKGVPYARRRRYAREHRCAVLSTAPREQGWFTPLHDMLPQDDRYLESVQ